MLDMQSLFGSSRDGHLADRLARIEARLNLIMQHLNIEYRDPADPASLPDEAKARADEKKKIQAIKVYRQHSGASLRDAKTAVESYMRGRPRHDTK